MKKKLKALVGMMSLCAVGTVGSAFALTRNSATATGTAGAFDKAIYLYWGHEASTNTMADCDSLQVNVPAYRYLTVSPQSTKSVAGTVTLSFTMAASDGAYSVDGVTVKVYKTDALCTDSTVAAAIENKTAVVSLDSNNLADTTQFAVTTSSTKHETIAYYAIEVKYDGTNLGTKNLGGTVSISQSFAA